MAINRLVVVPSEPIADYERAGLSTWLESYYNPCAFFDEVYALSPLEKGERKAYGMTIISVSERGFRKTLHTIQPDVVRAYGGYWAADLVCSQRLTYAPVVVSIHDRRPEMIHHSVRRADLLICLSGVVKQQVVSMGVTPPKIRMLPNRINTELFKPIIDPNAFERLTHRFSHGQKHILHVGRKSSEKNLDTLIHALQLLPKDYNCIFIGQGDCDPYIKLATDLRVTDRCFWIQSVPNAELPLWYSWCDCMCTPSRAEGFGIVFIEAAACGAAIVTTDMAPMNEYLTHNVNSWLVKDCENPQELAVAIQAVCEDQNYRTKIKKNAVKAAMPFEKTAVDTREVAIYQEAMALDFKKWSRLPQLAIWRAEEALHQTTHKLCSTNRARRAINRIWNNLT